MKKALLLLSVFLFIMCLTAEADVPVFGNSTSGSGGGFSLTLINNDLVTGAAVEFTPIENIDVSSVTLWLSGYTGQNGQYVSVAILNNFNNAPYLPEFGFASVAPNDGSAAAFTFSNPSAVPGDDPSGSFVLSANNPYWLLVQIGTEEPTLDSGCLWVGGGTPAGDAVYDGSEIYEGYAPGFVPSTNTPAFTINIVPEPSSAAILSIPLLFGLGGYAKARFFRPRTRRVADFERVASH